MPKTTTTNKIRGKKLKISRQNFSFQGNILKHECDIASAEAVAATVAFGVTVNHFYATALCVSIYLFFIFHPKMENKNKLEKNEI